MAGLDPAIHDDLAQFEDGKAFSGSHGIMDARIKSAHDAVIGAGSRNNYCNMPSACR